MRTCNKPDAILESQFMHMRCCAHILNLIVTVGLKEVKDFIVRVRSAVKYMKSSPARFEKFKSCVEREQLTFKGLLCLDVPTRWNSTFLMLEGAEKCQSAFQLIESVDLLIGIVLGFFSSFSNFFMMQQCDFRGLCIVHLICTSKKFVAFKCICKSILIVVIRY